LRRESERKKDRRDKQRNKQTKRKKEKKKDRKKLDELLGLEKRERYRRDRERENVLDFSVFQKNFERKRLKFPFPFSNLGTGKS
jgi:hypothetical protein